MCFCTCLAAPAYDGVIKWKYFPRYCPFHAVSANMIRRVYSGFWWYNGILVVHLQDSVGACWATTDRGINILGFFSVEKYYDWRAVEGLQLVMHTVISHYQKCWCVLSFCGRLMLKRVRSVTGMESWWRLVTYHSCFMLYNVYVWLHFTAKHYNLHCIVISPSLLWNQTHFGVISSIHEAKSLHRILLFYYNGFRDSWLSQQRGKDTQDTVSISVKMSYRKIFWNLEAVRFVSTIFRSLWNLTGTSPIVLNTYTIKK